MNQLIPNLIRPDPNPVKIEIPSSKKPIASRNLWIETGLNFGKRKALGNSEIRKERETSEQFRFMQTTAIGYQQMISKRFSIKLGLAYQTIFDKLDKKYTNIEEREIFSEEGIIYSLSNGSKYAEQGLAIEKTTTTRHIIHNNFTQRLSVPFEFIYAIQLNRWSIEPSLGFRFQFFENFNGIISQNGSLLYNLQEINALYYTNDLSIGINTSLYLKYTISRKGAIGLKLNYEKDDFLNLNKENFNLKLETFGLHLGYHHFF